ncbi:MAG: hypothetical protein ACI93P_001290 [bacterium]|jgi:hypothetical protein
MLKTNILILMTKLACEKYFNIFNEINAPEV